eukprot:3949991-Amphidinium_carterae.1
MVGPSASRHTQRSFLWGPLLSCFDAAGPAWLDWQAELGGNGRAGGGGGNARGPLFCLGPAPLERPLTHSNKPESSPNHRYQTMKTTLLHIETHLR